MTRDMSPLRHRVVVGCREVSSKHSVLRIGGSAYRRLDWKFAVLGATAGLIVSRSARSAPILAVDIQGNAAVSPVTESGFQAFNDVQDGHSTSFAYGGGFQSDTYAVAGVSSGSITVGLATVNGTKLNNQNWNDRDRGAAAGTDGGAYTDAELYRDFIFVQNGTYSATGTLNGLDITISGLNPNTQYSIDVYSWDNDAETGYFRDVTAYGLPGAGGNASSPNNASVAPYGTIARAGSAARATNEQDGLTQIFTSDGSGNVVINYEGSDSYEKINGLTISIVPGPTTFAAACIGFPLLLTRGADAAKRGTRCGERDLP